MFGSQEKGNIRLVNISQKVKGPGYANIFVDVQTGVQYLFLTGLSGAGGVTVMVDENGKPLLHEDYRPK